MTRVLIVEDESIVAKDVKRRLQKLGYAVSAVASSGEEAIKKIEDEPDIVLMDIVLKGEMDGIEAAEQIRTRHIPVIYVTAYADNKILERAKVTEPYGYILKPFEDRELHSVIEMALYKHKIEKKLKESQEWLATTLKSIGDGVIATDTKGMVTFLNPVAESLTGWTRKEAAGMPIEEVFCIIDKKTRERCENPVEKILKTGAPVELRTNAILVAKDGTERIVADNGAPIRGEDMILGAVLVFRDITEKQKMEQELLRAQKLESLSILAGGIAHDFTNILTAIVGYTNLAKMYSTQDTVKEKLTKIENASLQAKELMQYLLTFSKKGEPQKKIVSAAEMIKDAATFALRGSNVKCQFHISAELWPVDVDEGQISQVINNIIINADHSMPEGGIIQIRAENVVVEGNVLSLKEGNYVKISFTDEGIGIPEKHLQDIFDPYFTTKQKGSGLGLSASYSIITNHDGHISVESELGVGTTVHIYLPASQDEIEKEEEAVLAGEGRVLLMDNEEIIREAAGEVLQHLGYTVATAGDGEEAVEIYTKALAEGEPFDVVILDLTIPGGMGGKETLSRLKEIDPYVKAVICTGYADDPVTVGFKDYGFCSAVTKPYTVKELNKTLHTVLCKE